MFGIGGLEFIIIVVFALIIFGPDKMPEIGRLLAKGLKWFRDTKDQVEMTMKTEVFRPEDTQMLRELQRDFDQMKKDLANPERLFMAPPVVPREDEKPSIQDEVKKLERKLEEVRALAAEAQAKAKTEAEGATTKEDTQSVSEPNTEGIEGDEAQAKVEESADLAEEPEKPKLNPNPPARKSRALEVYEAAMTEESKPTEAEDSVKPAQEEASQ